MIAHMMNPYQQPYERFKGMGKVAGPSAAERQQAQQQTGTADLLRMLAGAAPAVGTGIGMLAGGPAGAAVGTGLGQMAGSLLGGGATMAERPALERQQARDQQIELLLKAFGR